jgi:NADH:ubiquinone oxidoreductase subunit 5 (subunit L)/multisubunit Na+/H+ antiporter MnhA subunit
MVPSEALPPVESIVPLITSLLVSLGGLWAGWQIYKPVNAGARDPLERFGILYKVLKSKYGVDEFYHAAFVRPSIWLSEVFTYKIVDKMILDGIIEGVGNGALRFGVFLREKIDIPLWNKGMTDGTSRAVRKSGEGMRPMQSGRIQQYMLATILVVAITGVVIFYLFV